MGIAAGMGDPSDPTCNLSAPASVYLIVVNDKNRDAGEAALHHVHLVLSE
jgi:hypothetical protein